MPVYELTKEQTINVIVEGLRASVGITHETMIEYRKTLESMDDSLLLRTLIHAHELREIKDEFESNKRREGVGWLFRRTSDLLSPSNVAKGYTIQESEDFIYLFLPGISRIPVVFNALNTDKRTIETYISQIEK